MLASFCSTAELFLKIVRKVANKKGKNIGRKEQEAKWQMDRWIDGQRRSRTGQPSVVLREYGGKAAWRLHF